MPNPKFLAAAGNLDFTIFWGASKPGLVDVNIYLAEKPDGNGLWMWDDGWRRPTNKELGAIFKGEDPFCESLQEKVDLDSWVSERNADNKRA